MGDKTGFFYGTLMAPEVLHRVCHGTSDPERWGAYNTLEIQPAILHGFQRHKVRNADYPAILPSDESSACVRGTLVTGLTEGDIWRLDIFEGSEYERRKVNVRVLDKVGNPSGEGNVESGEEIEADTYVWIAGEQLLEMTEWDFEEFVREKMVRWIGVTSDEYAEVDEAVKKIGDDPTRGRGRNGNITKSLEEHGEKAKEVIASAV